MTGFESITALMAQSRPDLGLAASLLVSFPVGIVLGAAHFLSLRLNAGLYLRGRLLPAIGLGVLRFAVLVAVLGLLTWLGAMALLAGALGLLLARSVIVRRMGKAA